MKLLNNKIINKIFGECPKDIPVAKSIYVLNIILMFMVISVTLIDFYYMMTTEGFVLKNFLREIGFILVVYFFIRVSFKRMWTKK